MALARRGSTLGCMGECLGRPADVARLLAPRSVTRSVATGPRGTGARLVLVEAGRLRLDAHAPPDGSEHTVVIVQGGDEPPAQSALRAMRRIRGLERSGHHVQGAIVLLAIRFDAEATAARLALVRALIRHREVTGARRLALLFSCSAGDLHTGLPAGLGNLVTAVTRESGSWSLLVSVRFVYADTMEPRSRVSASPPSASASAATASEIRGPVAC